MRCGQCLLQMYCYPNLLHLEEMNCNGWNGDLVRTGITTNIGGPGGPYAERFIAGREVRRWTLRSLQTVGVIAYHFSEGFSR